MILELAQGAGVVCTGCGTALCAHGLLLAIALGHRTQPLCPSCLARDEGCDRDALVCELVGYVGRRECYAAAWDWATVREPGCRLARPADRRGTDVAAAIASVDLSPSAEWDAGDLACGDLVLELRARMRAMHPGSLLLVTARDPGAIEDLPAWCRMTGHPLAYARPPLYFIRTKEG